MANYMKIAFGRMAGWQKGGHTHFIDCHRFS